MLRTAIMIAAFLGMLGSSASSGLAADEEPHAELRGFYASGEYDLVSASGASGAEILFSRRAAAYILIPKGSADTYLLRQRKQTVSKLTGSLLRHENGDVDVAKTARLDPAGSFTMADGTIRIEAGSLKAVLRPRAPLLGRKTADDVREHSPQYGLVARAYRPDKAALERLRAAGNVTVEVVFGSWCPRCKQTIGNALRIDSELAGKGPTFAFYGLPAPPAAWKDPRFLETKTKSLPTALVFVGEKLVGRVPPGDWKHLDVEIARLLK